MAKEINIKSGIDWVTIGLYITLLVIGYINIYAAVYNPDSPLEMFSISHNAGRQMLFAGGAFFLVMIILFIDFKVYDTFAFLIYGGMILLLIATIFLGSDIKGSKSWIKLGTFSLQPAEFAKTATALALAKLLSRHGFNLTKRKDIWQAAALILLPPVIIIAQKETGSALAFAIFIVVLFREGLPAIYPSLLLSFIILLIATLLFPKYFVVLGIAGLALAFWYLFLKRYERTKQNRIRILGLFTLFSVFVFGVNFFIDKVLQPHQQKRIRILVNPDADPLGDGWNVTQSKIAIGTGGFVGKGFLQGTQTKFNFVPEQSTDFIFCTIAEEWGFIGSAVLIFLFLALLYRIINLAEKQRDKFARVYGYCVASIIFFHILVNVGMTIGLMPVIGIPLPLISYGGSSLWSFTILLFIFLKLDAHRSYKV